MSRGGMRTSASVPILPAAGPAGAALRSGGSASRSTSQLAIADELSSLTQENELLRNNINSEKAKFGAKFVKDMHSSARRRIEPMRALLSEQSETNSIRTAEAAVKEQALHRIQRRVDVETTVTERRMQDGMGLTMKLQDLEAGLAEAELDASEACDREDTYAMMEKRLNTLILEDTQKANAMQRVIDESAHRLVQWHAVSKEGEKELIMAEAALAKLHQKLKAERLTQRKMMAERRSMVESMTKYSQERNERMAAHREKLMASRGDLDAEKEEQLKTAAGTIDTLRALNESSSRAALSFEEKCKDAFGQIQEMTGAKDLQEVLLIVTSKRELTEQLQKRVEATEGRVTFLSHERDNFDAQRSEARFGVVDDVAIKNALDAKRLEADAAGGKLDEVASRVRGTVGLLQQSRLAWENLVNRLEPGKRPGGRAATRSAAEGALAAPMQEAEAAAAEGVGDAGDDDGAAAGGGGEGGSEAGSAPFGFGFGGGGGISTTIPRELRDLPKMVEEVETRALAVLRLTAEANARREAEAAAKADAALAGFIGGKSKSTNSVFGSAGGGGDGVGADAAAGAAAAAASDGVSPTTRRKGGSSKSVAGGDKGGGSGEAAVSNNIRIKLPETLEAELAAAEKPRPPPGRQYSSKGSLITSAAAGGDGDGGDDEQPLTRDDLKATSVRLAKKGARKQALSAAKDGKK